MSPILSKEQIKELTKELLECYQLQPSTELESKIIVLNRHLILAIITRHFHSTLFSKEELIASGSVGMLKAIRSYTPDKQVLFASLAGTCIRNEILTDLRILKKQRLDISYEDAVSNIQKSDNNRDATFLELMPSPISVERQVDKNIEIERLHEGLQLLTERERFIIESRFELNGRKKLTQLELANILNIQQTNVASIEKIVLEKIYFIVESGRKPSRYFNPPNAQLLRRRIYTKKANKIPTEQLHFKNEMLPHMDILSDNERNILELFYGLNERQRLLQKDIAKVLGISIAETSRCKSRAIRKLLVEIDMQKTTVLA